MLDKAIDKELEVSPTRIHIVSRRIDVGNIPHNKEAPVGIVLKFACGFLCVMMILIFVISCAAKAVR